MGGVAPKKGGLAPEKAKKMFFSAFFNQSLKLVKNRPFLFPSTDEGERVFEFD
jgi:hypothetical protein